MPWRHLHLVRALSAAGLVGSLMFLGGAVATARPVDDFEPSTPPPDSATETVDLLKASRAGDLDVRATGQGQEQVRLSIRNASGKRLNVIIPPGLVAANTAGQGGRGFQSMGLGAITNRPGGFGQFQPANAAPGFQSIPINAGAARPSLAIPADETVDVSIPAVCLDYGVNPPSPNDGFTLMDVSEFSDDARVRTALRGLALLGTSQGVAQAVMWRVRDNVSFEKMAASGGKVINPHEAALAARFVDAVDSTPDDQPIDPALLTRGRVFVQVEGAGSAQAEASRLNQGLAGLHLMGLPIQVADGAEAPAAQAPAILVKVAIAETSAGTTRGRVVVSYCSSDDQWRPLGKTAFEDRGSIATIDAQGLAQTLDAELARAFVAVKMVKKSASSTTLKVENRLPFSLAGVRVRAGDSSGSPVVPFPAVGVGPARSTTLPIQAGQARIESVELNGL